MQVLAAGSRTDRQLQKVGPREVVGGAEGDCTKRPRLAEQICLTSVRCFSRTVRLGKTGHRSKPRTGNQKGARIRIDQLGIQPGFRRHQAL